MNFKTCISFWHVYVEKKTVSPISTRVSQRKYFHSEGSGSWWCFINAFVLMKWNKGYSEQGWWTCFPQENPWNWLMRKQQSEQQTRGDTWACSHGSIWSPDCKFGSSLQPQISGDGSFCCVWSVRGLGNWFDLPLEGGIHSFGHGCELAEMQIRDLSSAFFRHLIFFPLVLIAPVGMRLTAQDTVT